MADGPPPARVLLVGMMGVGKTTVGRLLAGRLGWGILDSDEEVTATTGRTVAEIFAEDGEAAFRTEESRALARAVSGSDPVVVSVAGGAVLDESNRELLVRSGLVVWLRAEPSTLATRVGSGAGRPLLGDDPAPVLASIDAERRPLYREVAQYTVDVDGLAPGEVVDRLLAVTGLTGSGQGQVAPGSGGA